MNPTEVDHLAPVASALSDPAHSSRSLVDLAVATMSLG